MKTPSVAQQTEFKTKPPLRRRGGRPQLRSTYGPYILELLEYAPSEWMIDNDHRLATLRFLHKLGTYLCSDEYKAKTEKNIRLKKEWLEKQK